MSFLSSLLALIVSRVCKSAGFSALGTYLYSVNGKDLISVIRFLTKSGKRFSLLIQQRTIWLSDHRTVLSILMYLVSWSRTKFVNFLPITAAMSSNLGKVIFLTGATRFF